MRYSASDTIRVRVYSLAPLVEADLLAVDRLEERRQEQADRPRAEDVNAARGTWGRWHLDTWRPCGHVSPEYGRSPRRVLRMVARSDRAYGSRLARGPADRVLVRFATK